MKEPVIVAGVRTPIARAHKGSLVNMRIDDLGAVVVRELLNRVPQIDKKEIDDLIIGCAFPEGEQGMNVARLIGLLAGLPIEVPAVTVNRFCGSSMEALHIAAKAIMAEEGDIFIVGGIETMTKVPMGGYNPSFNEKLIGKGPLPWAYIPMGLTAENVAKKYGIKREEQDIFALNSHKKAIAAIDGGKFKDEIVPVELPEGRVFDTDECPRRDTSLEALAKLKPAFLADGTVTAGNSSPLNDGAAALMVMSMEKCNELGVKPIAFIRGMAVVGVEPEYMGLGPIYATRKVMKRLGMTVDKMDAIELNEAFAAQSLACIKELELDINKVNINGGAIALGHPLGCSGARILVTLINVLKQVKGKWGLATMCVGGGQGIATVIEMV